MYASCGETVRDSDAERSCRIRRHKRWHVPCLRIIVSAHHELAKEDRSTPFCRRSGSATTQLHERRNRGHAVPGDARKKCVRRIRSPHRRSSYAVPYIPCSARSYVSRSQTRPCIGCSFAVHSAFDLTLRRHNTTEHTLFWCFSRSTTVHSCCRR